MAEGKTSRRLMGLLRRTAGSSRVRARTTADESALWTAYEKGIGYTRDAGEAAQRIASNMAKQRVAADALADRAHAVAARAQDLASGFSRMTDVFERLGLVALNAGLEGARLGEGGGRPLLLLSDEVRSHATRGADGARELSSTVAELITEAAKLGGFIDQVKQASSDASQEAARAAAKAAEAERALVKVGAELREATGSDPETVRMIAEAGEHVRALVTTLGALSEKVPRQILTGTLRPVLEPLARALTEDDADDEGR
jgi:methyl-accepting chemotaxis protein